MEINCKRNQIAFDLLLSLSFDPNNNSHSIDNINDDSKCVIFIILVL